LSRIITLVFPGLKRKTQSSSLGFIRRKIIKPIKPKRPTNIAAITYQLLRKSIETPFLESGVEWRENTAGDTPIRIAR
jgi:hypothetical protein